MNDCIYLEGQRLQSLPPLRSIFYGEGLFETFRWFHEGPRFWDLHMERMERGAELLGLHYPGPDVLRSRVQSAVDDSGLEDGYVKLCLLSEGQGAFFRSSAGTRVMVVLRDYEAPIEEIRLTLSPFKKPSHSPLVSIKSLNYLENILARREAAQRGFDEALMLNERGEIAEASSSNVFWLMEGVLFTPAVDCGILPGTTRGVVSMCAKDLGLELIEGYFPAKTLLEAEGVFLTNSLNAMVIVSELDGKIGFKPNRVYQELSSELLSRLGWT